ncbi:GntR family transcriptional regulator [Thermotoga caldifontis]|uniref:GntR family transcriptional regulator n=1 Tax=Thermotoga caldifontis TaxID=1508419 RepID=UPI000597E86E|nr:GntR family transcriptional regulator [Thermotoga caldifontis]
MWFRVDFSSHVPVYKQIKEKLKLLLLSGELKPGDFVPSIRTLANDLGVNVNTVARAYRELVAEGVLEPVRGEGYVVKRLNLNELVESTLDRFRSTVEECKRVGIEPERLIILLEEVYGRRDDGSQCERTGEEL